MATQSNHTPNDTVLIAECLQYNRRAQEQLYNQYAPKMYAVCLRFSGGNADDAKDFLQESFLKVFRKLDTFKGEGSFEGWIRRTVIFTCIALLRRKKIFSDAAFETIEVEDKELTGYDNLAMDDLLEIIGSLSDGYRTVLNLYLVEGYSHKEIGELLGIKETSSKSQLSRAKVVLQKKIEHINKIHVG